MQASELFKQSNTVLLDGGMGTMLQASGLKLGAKPEELNITNPELIESIHAKYAAAGSRIVNANNKTCNGISSFFCSRLLKSLIIMLIP